MAAGVSNGDLILRSEPKNRYLVVRYCTLDTEDLPLWPHPKRYHIEHKLSMLRGITIAPTSKQDIMQ
jgi:hypothetical protein